MTSRAEDEPKVSCRILKLVCFQLSRISCAVNLYVDTFELAHREILVIQSGTK